MDSFNNVAVAAIVQQNEADGKTTYATDSTMNIGFSVDTVILVGVPVDMRCGFMRLNAFVDDRVGLDLTKERRAVVFFNRPRSIAKVVSADRHGVRMSGNLNSVLLRIRPLELT